MISYEYMYSVENVYNIYLNIYIIFVAFHEKEILVFVFIKDTVNTATALISSKYFVILITGN